MKLAPVLRWWNARNAREKILAVMAAVVTVGSVADTILLQPQRVQQTAIGKQLKSARAQLTQLQKLAQEHSQESNAQLRTRTEALIKRRNRAEQVIRDAQVDLIAPKDMGKQLAAILARFPELRIVAINTLPPSALTEVAVVKTASNNSNGNSATPAQSATVPNTVKSAAAQGLYQHSLDISVEGRYLDLIAYLQALEKAPYRVYWRELDMQVNPDGMPVTRVSLYTLSRESIWLKL